MFQFLFFGIIALFGGMLFLNVYFRVKVFKVYKYLVQNKVQFGWSHFFHEDRLSHEIIAKYPQHETEIRTFVRLIRRSVTMASILIFLILCLGYLLMKYGFINSL